MVRKNGGEWQKQGEKNTDFNIPSQVNSQRIFITIPPEASKMGNYVAHEMDDFLSDDKLREKIELDLKIEFQIDFVAIRCNKFRAMSI